MQTKLDSFEKWIFLAVIVLIAVVFLSSPKEYLLFAILSLIVYKVDTSYGEGFAFLSFIAISIALFLIDRFVMNVPLFDSLLKVFL